MYRLHDAAFESFFLHFFVIFSNLRLWLELYYRLTLQHVWVSSLRNSESVRRHFSAPFSAVLLDHTEGVDGQTSVRVDHNAEKTRVRLQVYKDRIQFTNDAIFVRNFVSSTQWRSRDRLHETINFDYQISVPSWNAGSKLQEATRRFTSSNT